MVCVFGRSWLHMSIAIPPRLLNGGVHSKWGMTINSSEYYRGGGVMHNFVVHLGGSLGEGR